MSLPTTSRCGVLRVLWALSSLLCVAPASLAQSGETVPFTDRAAASGLDFVNFNGMTGKLYFVEMMGGGLALIDYDRDGDLDVYLVQGTLLAEDVVGDAVFAPVHPVPLTDRLYRNDSWIDDSGTHHLAFADVSEVAGLPAGDYGLGVASADIDNDGWPDLYVNNFGPNRLLRNRGDGTFEDVTESSGTAEPRWSAAASFFDFDDDGLLDLYVGNYVDYRMATDRPCFSDTGVLDYCGPGAFSGVTDRLFRNLGGGAFEDVSKRSGIGTEPGKGLGSVVSDFDGDGRLDLYVTNDGERNFMWLNQGDGTFLDGALLSGTAVNDQGMPEASMGVVVGDLDGDGRDDLFMSHLKSETNTLYRNEGGGLFVDTSGESGLGLPSWSFTGFGIGLVDFDNDTDLDMYVGNGAVLLLEDLVLAGDPYPIHQRNLLFRNEGEGQFTDVSDAAGEALAPSEVSRGVAVGDIDNDGDGDLTIWNSAGPARLLVNEHPGDGDWVGLATRTLGTRDALGSRVMALSAAGVPVWRRVSTDGSFASSGDPRALLGLGTGALETTVEIWWSGGGASRFLEVPTGRYLTVVHPEARP